MKDGRKLQETMDRARDAWSARWRIEAMEEQPKRFHYSVDFECTQETWENIRKVLASFPLSNKHARVREV